VTCLHVRNLIKKKSHLKNHIDSCHKNIKFSCTLCEALLSSQSSLRRHFKNIHERETPFVCDFENCNSKFHSEDLLVKHISEHTGLLPYGCSYEGCEKRFFFPVQLRNHIENIHEKIRSCATCSESFDTKKELSEHMAKHCVKIPCEFCGVLFKTTKTLKFHIFLQALRREHNLSLRYLWKNLYSRKESQSSYLQIPP